MLALSNRSAPYSKEPTTNPPPQLTAVVAHLVLAHFHAPVAHFESVSGPFCWPPITSAGHLSPRGISSGHECSLAVKPNQPEDDGEYGVPDVALPNVALPISHRQLPACHIKSPQSARPLIRGHEREANGSKQDKYRDHCRLLLQPADYAPIRSIRLRPEIQTETLPNLGTISSLSTT
jgi:hypothetical protein